MRINLDKIQKRKVYAVDKRLGIESYDRDNLYPQRTLDILAGSGAASICIERLKKYIIGQGFEDEGFAQAVVNTKGQTANHLLRQIAKDYSYINGFAIHVNYDALMQPVEAQHIPFKYCRLAIADDQGYISKVAVYDNWDMHRKKRILVDDIDFIDVFNPDPEIVAAQVEAAGGFEHYKGQILWYSNEGEMVYPLSTCDPVLEDVEVDSQIKLFKYRNITSGFMASHLLVTKGKFETDEARREFSEKITEFQGADNFNKIFWAEVELDEQVPNITPFSHQNNDRLYEYHESSVQENIRMNYGLPPVLFKSIPGQLGDNSERMEAIRQYNEETSDERMVIEEQFQRLFSLFPDANPSENFKIKTLSIDSTI